MNGNEATQTEDAGILFWRDQVLNKLLSTALVLGAMAYVPSVALSIRDGYIAIAILDTLALLWVAVLTFRRSLPYDFRAINFILVVYILGAWFLVFIGPVSEIYLMAVPILTGLLMGFRPAILALALNAVTLFGLGYTFEASFHLGKYETDPFAKWLVVTVNFMFVDTMLTLATVMLLRRVEQALRNQTLISRSLATEQDQLRCAFAALEQEVTARKSAQEQVMRLAMAAEQSHEIILMADEKGAVVYENPMYARITGKNASTLGAAGFAAFHVLNEFNETAGIGAAIASGQLWRGCVQLDAQDGKPKEMDTSIAPVRDVDGTLISYIAVMRDVTREHEMEARLQRSEKLEAVGILAGGIAHDFNNILGAILGIAELAKKELASNPLETRMDDIIRASHRGRDIVRQMLLFSRQGEALRRPVALKEIVDEFLPLLRASIPSSIEIHARLDCPGTVVADPTELHQVIMNLCTNACQAMEGSGGAIELGLRVYTPDSAFAAAHPPLEVGLPYVCLTISDTGPGIDKETLQRIFDPFFTTKERGKGTGLGLATVHGIVGSLQGCISVYSEVGQGTSFSLCLPMSDAAPEPLHPVAEAGAQPLTREVHALLVDDEEMLLEVAEIFLTDSGYTVTTAADGEKALDIFRENPDYFDILITDLTMPRVSGEALVIAIRAIRPDLPAILISGFGESLNADMIAALRLDGFLQKPFSQKELSLCVQKALAARADG